MATMHQLLAEAYRLRLMRGLDDAVRGCGYGLVAGVDEAGRGCLAGPVVAAAVVPRAGHLIPGVDDSKCVAAEERERLAAAIRSAYPLYAVVAVSAREIDRVNILQATRQAMSRALAALDPAPEVAVVDAVKLPAGGYPCLPVIRGDQVSYAVACASILAKVTRDRLMVDLDRRYPLYAFAANKGYAAPEHRRALAAYGPSPEHRLTFRSVLPRREPPGARPRRAVARACA